MKPTREVRDMLKGYSSMYETRGDLLRYEDYILCNVEIDGRILGQVSFKVLEGYRGGGVLVINSIETYKGFDIEIGRFLEGLVKGAEEIAHKEKDIEYVLLDADDFSSSSSLIREYIRGAYINAGELYDRYSLREVRGYEDKGAGDYEDIRERVELYKDRLTGWSNQIKEAGDRVLIQGQDIKALQVNRRGLGSAVQLEERELGKRYARLLNQRFDETKGAKALKIIYKKMEEDARERLEKEAKKIERLEKYTMDNNEMEKGILRSIRERIRWGEDLSEGQNRWKDIFERREIFAKGEIEKYEVWQRVACEMVVRCRLKNRESWYNYDNVKDKTEDEIIEAIRKTALEFTEWTEEEKKIYQTIEQYEMMQKRISEGEKGVEIGRWISSGDDYEERGKILTEYVLKYRDVKDITQMKVKVVSNRV